MRKTSVYLPDELKEGLAALAHRSGQSEADLLRTAVERLLRAAASEGTPRATPTARPSGPALVGVGVGPGDPGLLTERAATLVANAGRVFAATTGPDAIGRAEAVIRSIAPEVRVDRLTLDIVGSPEARGASLAHAADAVVDALDTSAVVAFLTLGDPNVFSTFPALARLVAARRPGVPISTVPGVMAFQELAAETSTVLAEDDEHLVLAVATADTTALDAMLGAPADTVVLYKGGRHLPAVAERLRSTDRIEGAVVGEMLGLLGGRAAPVSTVDDRPASYLATVVVPAVRAGHRR